MAEKRFVFPLLAFWEAGRVVLLIIILHRFLPAELFAAGSAIIVILLLVNGTLIVPAGALYLFFTKKQSTPLVLTLCAAKAAELVTCLLGVGVVAVGFLRATNAPALVGALFLEGTGFLIIFLIDLIFLLRLLSFKAEEM
jgi:hypothetical protein